MGTIHRIPGEVRHYEANEALCNARQETREIVYVTESGLLRYKREDGTYMYVGASGKLQTSDAGSGQIVARTISEGPYPSGVPGTDVNGDITLGDYLVFKMVI